MLKLAAVEKPKNFKKSLLDVDDLFMSGSDKNSSTGSSSTNSFCANLSIIGSLFNSAKAFPVFFCICHILYKSNLYLIVKLTTF